MSWWLWVECWSNCRRPLDRTGKLCLDEDMLYKWYHHLSSWLRELSQARLCTRSDQILTVAKTANCSRWVSLVSSDAGLNLFHSSRYCINNSTSSRSRVYSCLSNWRSITFNWSSTLTNDFAQLPTLSANLINTPLYRTRNNKKSAKITTEKSVVALTV